MRHISWGIMDNGMFMLIVLLLLLTVYCGKTILHRDLRKNPKVFLKGQFNHLIAFFAIGLCVVWSAHVFALLGVK